MLKVLERCHGPSIYTCGGFLSKSREIAGYVLHSESTVTVEDHSSLPQAVNILRPQLNRHTLTKNEECIYHY